MFVIRSGFSYVWPCRLTAFTTWYLWLEIYLGCVCVCERVCIYVCTRGHFGGTHIITFTVLKQKYDMSIWREDLKTRHMTIDAIQLHSIIIIKWDLKCQFFILLSSYRPWWLRPFPSWNNNEHHPSQADGGLLVACDDWLSTGAIQTRIRTHLHAHTHLEKGQVSKTRWRLKGDNGKSEGTKRELSPLRRFF